MERLYCSLAGVSSIDPLSLISSEQKYDYDDVQTWLPKVVNHFCHAKHPVGLLVELVGHLHGSIAFRQFNNEQIRAMVICVGRFFGREGLKHHDQMAVLDFLVALFDSRAPGELEETFGESLASVELVAQWCLERYNDKENSPDDQIAITTFIAFYGLFGSHEAGVVQLRAANAIDILVKVFQESVDSKVDIRLRLNWVLTFFNIHSRKLSGPTVKVADKLFSSRTNLEKIVDICADTIDKAIGGLHATKVACILLGRLSRSSGKVTKHLERAVQVGFKMLRRDKSPSMEMQTVLLMLIELAKLPQLKVKLVEVAEADEAKHGNSLLVTLLQKDPLKHGALSETAAALLSVLELDLKTQKWINSQFNSVYTALTGPKDHPNINFVYSKLTALAQLLSNTFAPCFSSTQTHTDHNSGPIKIAKVLCGSEQTKKPSKRDTIHCMSEACHFVFGTIHRWLGTAVVEQAFKDDIYYKRFLVQSVASLLESNQANYRLLAMEIIRDDGGHTIDLGAVSSFFSFDRSMTPASTSSDKSNTKWAADVATLGKRRRTCGGTEVGAITTQRAMALTKVIEDELAATKSLYESERQMRIALENALAVKSTNQYWSHSLITSLDNTDIEKSHKISVLDKELAEEKRRFAAVDGEHEDLKSVLKNVQSVLKHMK